MAGALPAHEHDVVAGLRRALDLRHVLVAAHQDRLVDREEWRHGRIVVIIVVIIDRRRYAGIVVAVGRGTVDVHFLDGDFAAGVNAAAVSLHTGRRLRVGAGPALAKGQKIATLKEPTVPLVVVAFDDAYAVVSGPDGNRAYQRDVLRAFDDNDSSDDEAPAAPPLDAEALDADAPAAPMEVDDDDAPAAPPPLDDDDDDDDDDAVTPLLAVDETVLVGSNKHVAKVERATCQATTCARALAEHRPPRGDRLVRSGAARSKRGALVAPVDGGGRESAAPERRRPARRRARGASGGARR